MISSIQIIWVDNSYLFRNSRLCTVLRIIRMTTGKIVDTDQDNYYADLHANWFYLLEGGV